MKEQEGYDWSAEMLSSLILPKLLSLKKLASRILVNAILQAGKVHQRETVDALLLPLILNKEGLNVVVCEKTAYMQITCLLSSKNCRLKITNRVCCMFSLSSM